MLQHVQVIYFVIRCEAKFSKVRFSQAGLLGANLAPSVKPSNVLIILQIFSASRAVLKLEECSRIFPGLNLGEEYSVEQIYLMDYIMMDIYLAVSRLGI